MTGRTRAVDGAVGGRLALVAALLVVLALMLFVRPGGSSGGAADPAPEPSASTGPAPVMPSATPATPPSEEAFCAAYRRLASAQGQYAAAPDGKAVELLREAADELLATGVPISMTTAARGGYFIELSGIYSSIGLQLDRRAIPGAFEGADPAEDPTTAYGEFLTAYCPAW